MIIASRYKVLEELGTGLWAKVYKVQDMRTENIYRLKLFHKLAASSLYEKFSAEKMHHITKIQHVNLIQVVDFGNYGPHIYYISTYCKGKTLKDFRLRSGNLNLLYDIIVQICYGLNALHSQNIIHQDLKPENVLYQIESDRPKVKIMDYGFTKLDLEKGQQNISSNLPYVAPEIYLDQKIEYRSDFYSLGVMLYKIVTGSLPYTVEQITGFIEGKRYNLFPKFPRELNPNIPSNLEKLILKLLERNSNDRFENCESIISYINKIQMRQYPFSQKWSIVNNISFSDYIVREDYAHQLLEYVPLIEKGNGKVIVISAGKGLGKTNALALFRYHLLTDDFYIFDYECGPKHKDPFFALIKEFYFAVENNKKLAEDLSDISTKLRKYLFESEEAADIKTQNKEDLSLDFKSASAFLFHLSEEKPLIFTIRSGQYLEKEVIDFVNFISQDITKKPILIIFSINDPRKIEGLIHPVRIKIEALDREQTKKYVHRLLNVSPPDHFLEDLWNRSNGNPLFIEQILIDLTQNRKIWKKNKFNFDFKFKNYYVPEDVRHSIYQRMAHLSEDSYRNLQKLSYVQTPLSKELMKYILSLNEKQVFFLITDAINNELIRKYADFYQFTFKEAVARWQHEIGNDEEKQVSKKVLEYFNDKTLTLIEVIEGVIKHANIIKDFTSVRKYKLLLVKIFFEGGERGKAFDVMISVVQLDFSSKLELPEGEFRKDLRELVDKSEWTTTGHIPATLKRKISKMPNIAEKHYLMGVYYLVAEKYNLAQCRFENALKLAITGKIRAEILLKLAEIYSVQGDINNFNKAISELDTFQLSPDLKTAYISLKGLYLGVSGKLSEGINLIEEYLPSIQTQNDDAFFVRLGNLHNTLAFLYHKDRILDEADKNFHIARKIWEKVNYKRKLGIVYNNIGDVALVQGYTNEAIEYFRKALLVCQEVGCKKIRVLSLLNHGETFIKLGDFKKAEKYLDKAREESLNHENKPFLDSILNNIAIAKGKLFNFKYYYDFIEEFYPDLLEGKITTVKPLIKTYFYYLYNIGNYKKIDQLLEKYKDLFLDNNQQEFFYQILGFITLKRNNYKEAFKRIQLAYEYSQESRSVYAQAINYIRMAEYYTEVGKTGQAIEILLQSRVISEQNNFNYWIRVIDLRMIRAHLMEGSSSLRILIRKLYNILDYVKKNDLFHLEIECYEILLQIYAQLGIAKQAEYYFKLYRLKVRESVAGLPQQDKILFFKKTHFHANNYQDFKTIKINYKKYKQIREWQEELYDILKLKDNKRIKFFIDKTIKTLLSPNYFAILLNDNLKNRSEPFLIHNLSPENLYTDQYLKNINRSIETNTVLQRKVKGCHILYIPLRIKSAKVGCMLIADQGELEFQSSEMEIILNLRLHLSSILIRIKEFTELNEDMKLMAKLIEINQKFFSPQNLEKLEQDAVTFVLDFIGGSRGFLIKKDKFENYIFKIALDDSKHLLKNYSYISKSILSEVQNSKESIFLENVSDNKVSQTYFDFKAEQLSVFCAPILIDDRIYGFIYIDNYQSPENKFVINSEFMRLLFIQLANAVKNALQYEMLMQKNKEIKSLENLKNEFINIVSHELRTPLVTLQGYVNRMLKFKIPKKDLKIVNQVEKSIDRLYLITNDIINHNKYILLKGLDKNLTEIKDILNVVADETRSISKSRHMQIQLEIEQTLPPVKLNWEAFYLMIYNIVLNSIRFTKDFGTIVIGARLSAFQQEEVGGRESLLIYIQDNGIGIPESEQKRIFKKFYEVNKISAHSSGSIEFKSSGLGLGLSTAKLIVELHDGKIWINSKENEGTTVFIAIPLINEKMEKR